MIKTVNMSRKVLKFYAKGKKYGVLYRRLCYMSISKRSYVYKSKVCG